MNSTPIYSTQATGSITVSTVLVRDGAVRFYETAIKVAGEISDGRRASKKFEAGLEHDEAVAWARGYTDPHNRRHAFWQGQLQELAR